MNVWTYWEGPRWPHIDICLRSLEAACKRDDVTLHIVTPETVGDYIPQGVLNANYMALQQPALRADCIRAALLAVHGGWWWDADSIGFGTLTDLHAKYGTPECLYLTWRREPRRVINGYIYFNAGSPLAAAWLEQVNRVLTGDVNKIAWCSLGEHLLNYIVPEHAGSVEVERRLFLPVDIDSEVARFFRPGNPLDWIERDTVCFGLNHSWMVYRRKERGEMLQPEHVRLASPLLIHRLLTLAERFSS